MKIVKLWFVMIIMLLTIISQKNVENIKGKDFAIENSDYIDENLRKERVMRALDPNVTYGSNLIEYPDFKTAYFDNLTYNFGMNYKGSCGYVAMASLLSYYDTYYNDEIIPENYDINSVGNGIDMVSRRNSPGILKDIIFSNSSIESYGTMTASSYYSSISALENQSLHAKLILTGAKYGYYDFNDDKNPCGTTFYSRKVVLQDYLNTTNLNYQLITYNGENDFSQSNMVRNFTIEKIKQGYPILLSMGSAILGGHVVIAYDYNEDLDEIYCHMGWSAEETHVVPEDYTFTFYKTATIINFFSSHSHSNNYGVTKVINNIPQTLFYCYDSSSIYTYTLHVHQYDNVVYYDRISHAFFCSCGERSEITECHTIDPLKIIKNKTSCLVCGKMLDLKYDVAT